MFLWYLKRQMPVSRHFVALRHGDAVGLYEKRRYIDAMATSILKAFSGY